jgi:hypothetical protein
MAPVNEKLPNLSSYDLRERQRCRPILLTSLRSLLLGAVEPFRIETDPATRLDY